ncbi:MAG: hypothetical protein ACPGU3_05455 [Litorivicinus sp.]
MKQLKLAALLAVLLGGITPSVALADEAATESKVCADGSPCPTEDAEPSDEELEESCD